MDRVILSSEDARPLQHHLNRLPILDPVNLSPAHGLPQGPTHVPRVVELNWRVPREIARENPLYALLMCLEQGKIRREHERDVVHAGSEPGPVRALARASACARRAIEKPEPDREEKAVVNVGGDGSSVWASEARCESSCRGRVVKSGHGGHNGLDLGTTGRAGGRFVLEDCSCGGVVEWGALRTGVGSGRNVVTGRGLVGFDEDIGGLARPEHEDVGGEGLHVGGVGPNYLVNWKRTVARAIVEIAGLTVDRVSIGYIRSSPCSHGLSHNINWVCIPPFTCSPNV
ncbi:interleukin-12 subunit beta [Striga asiatica]|uniref:Interleukin-12 subunit beta n=1 Tax=Striga asiatica TaxID=4170 RepID=A0A5A7QZS4_STRAF|nr:interleukin-12 subunit beta [Striga asiatica]